METSQNQRFKQFRITAELETQDLSDITGISKSLIEKIESGRMEVTDKTAKRLKEKCNLPIEWLMEGKGELYFDLQPVNPYRDYLLKKAEEEIKFLRETVKALASKSQANFRNRLWQAPEKSGQRSVVKQF